MTRKNIIANCLRYHDKENLGGEASNRRIKPWTLEFLEKNEKNKHKKGEIRTLQ